CTHLGCTVLPGAGELDCPCHGSIFNLAGGFVQGPAGTGLLRYVAAFDGTTVTVSTTFRASDYWGWFCPRIPPSACERVRSFVYVARARMAASVGFMSPA